MIDDGSTDRSGFICEEYADRDCRIHVIHQKNGGAAAAKNTGLDAATGDYLAFADSDDWLELNAYEHMADLLIEKDADVVQGSFTEEYVNKSVPHENSDAGREYDTRTYLKRFTTDWTCALLWDKLYKKKLFDGIRFETGHIVDDEFFTYQGMMRAKTIICDGKKLYHYRKRQSSATENPDYKERIIQDKLDYLVKRKNKIGKEFPELKRAFNCHFMDMVVWMAEDPTTTELSLSALRNILGSEWKQCRNSGEGIRTDIRILQLLYGNPKKIQRRIEYEKTDPEETKEKLVLFP